MVDRCMVALRVALGGRLIVVGSIAVALFVIGCASRPRGAAAGGGPATLEAALAMLEARDAWQAHPPIHLPRHPAERFLRGWVIVRDPGHGGDAHRAGYKRGSTGEREAEMNW